MTSVDCARTHIQWSGVIDACVYADCEPYVQHPLLTMLSRFGSPDQTSRPKCVAIFTQEILFCLGTTVYDRTRPQTRSVH